MWLTGGGGTFPPRRLFIDDFHVAHADDTFILLTAQTWDLVEKLVQLVANLRPFAEVCEVGKVAGISVCLGFFFPGNAGTTIGRKQGTRKHVFDV